MDKPSITVEVARCLVRQQFPSWASLEVQPVERDGWDNTTFRLGEELSLRLPSADAYVTQVDKEHQWLAVLGPQLPLAIPEPVARGVAGCGFPRPWSVYRWLPGQPVDLAGVVDVVDHLAGALVAVARPLGQRPGDHVLDLLGQRPGRAGERRDLVGDVLGEHVDAGRSGV